MKETNAERLRRLRADARANGMCGECRARKAKPGRSTCVVCLERQAVRVEKHPGYGLCRCGAMPVIGMASCQKCLDRGSDRDRRRRRVKQATGECMTCSHDRAPNRSQCMQCLAKSAHKQKALRARAIAAGFCGSCRRLPLWLGHLCMACLEALRVASERRRHGNATTRKNHRHSHGGER